MKRTAVLCLISSAFTASAGAQLGERNELGVRMGHVHLLVPDVEEHKRFWTEMLGGRIVRNGPLELIEFPGIYVMLTQVDDAEPPAGAIVDHFGFFVNDMEAGLERWRSGGLEIEPTQNPNEVYLITPGRIRVEVYGEPQLADQPIAATHIHYYAHDVPAIKAWYVSVFGANPSWRPCVACISNPRMHATADIGSVNLTLAPSDTQRLPTRGRGIDHVGFDVEDIDAFVRRLDARGIALEGPVREVPGMSLKFAFLTDPWGTRIELTEGLAPRER